MAIKVQSANNTIRVGVSTGSSTGSVQATYDPTEYYSNLARDWAIKMDGKVQEQDYSSKYYAQQSKNSCDTAIDMITDFDDHVQQVQDNFNANAQNKINEATIWAEGTDEQVQALGGEHSAKGWAELGGQDIEDATTDKKGIIQIATEQEADEGLNTDKAMTPALVSKEISDNVGRGIVLGFDGILENNVLTFAPADGIAYDLKNNYDYEIDLHFPAVGLLPDDTDVRIINGMDEIAIRNVLSGSLNATYGDLRQVCDYIEDIGWRWIFTARYKSVNSDRAFVMQATTVALQQTLENASEHTVPSTKAVFEAIEEKGAGLELCDIGTALYVDESLGLRRYLNGQVVAINSNTQAFLNRLKEIQAVNPDWFTTEENWQAEALLSEGGYVDKFVIANDESTVRLPNYPDFITVLDDKVPVIGNGMSMGLTDGTYLAGLGYFSAQTNYPNGLIGVQSKYGVEVGSSIGGSNETFNQASVGLTLDPEKSGVEADLTNAKQTLTLKYFIQIATGTETENNIINEIELNNPYTLFDCKYTEASLYNISWLLSNGTFYSKSVYVTAYEALQVEYNSEIAQGTTVQLPSGTSYTKRGLSVKLSTDSDVTDYDFVINTTDEIFRLPLKTKLASGNAVVGNGMTLGLTNGTQNFGFAQGEAGNTRHGYTNAYGQPYGYYVPAGDPSSFNNSIGVTTDPTKSGIETSDQDLYLYFYVGETVQNANLIDAGRIEENMLTRSNKAEIISWGMPDYSATISIGTLSANTPYTAPCDGILYTSNNINGTGTGISYVNGVTIRTGSNNTDDNLSILLSKGDIYTCSGILSGADAPIFIPLKGVN